MKRILCSIKRTWDTTNKRSILTLHCPVVPPLHQSVLCTSDDRAEAERSLAEINQRREQMGKVPLVVAD